MRSLILAAVVVLLFAVSCDGKASVPKKQQEQAVQQRGEVFAAASAAAPVVAPQNFPLRKALLKYTARQDLLNHPWYIYIQGDQGNTIGYFVGQTYPLSTCDFLSSTQITDSNSSGRVVLTAPSLDGIYYGGSGASGGCDYFFFDAATDAMQVISATQKWFVSDAPLSIDAKPIKVSQ